MQQWDSTIKIFCHIYVCLASMIMMFIIDYNILLSFYRDETNLSLEETLKEHFGHFPGLSTVETEDEIFNQINVRRKHIWSDAVRAISKPVFNPLNPIRVTFISESAVDLGGPRREFFSLGLLKAAEDPGIFCGPPEARLFVHSLQSLRNRTFYKVGMFTALSLAHGGPGLTCLSKTVYSYLCFGLQKGKVVCNVQEIPDVTVRKHLQKVCMIVYI